MSIDYRPFRNADPPQVVRLWHDCELGRGAALGFPCEIFDLYVLAEPYFDRNGLILALDGKEAVGFVHAGFGSNAAGTALATETGVISAVMVRPSYRRQGIGRELISRAENYLKNAGARELTAGEAAPRNPFYLGLYGGSESVGFLESDANAAPFFAKLGYRPAERRLLFRRDITQRNDGFDPRLVAIRRKFQLGVLDRPPQAGWWWMTRQGRLDSICFTLVPQAGGEPVAILTCWGMDMHSITWRERTVGFLDLSVNPQERRKGYGKALLLESIRRLREEMVTHVEAAALETDVASLGLLRSIGFQQVDAGVVFRREG